jgi:hypothetical protein
MKRIAGIGLVLGLIAGGIVAGLVAIAIHPLPPSRPPGEWRPPAPPGDISLFYLAKTIVSFVNITLLVALLFIYANVYSKVRSRFTIGLVMITIALLLYALTSNPLLQILFGFRAEGLGPFALIPDLFATVASVVLLYLSLD